MRVSVSRGRPSSMIALRVRNSGVAPATARSFTVPCTASEPMLPPGNSSGWTVNESVVIIGWPSGNTSGTASASASSDGLPSCRKNTSAISSRMKRPPLPWASET